MKGILKVFNEEKMFGFITDMTEKDHFFHISDVLERDEFLESYQELIMSIYDKTCNLLEFESSKNKKGNGAKNISLTSENFNDLSGESDFLVYVKKIEFNNNQLTRIVSGKKKGDDIPSGATAGGNGTYRIGYPESYRDLLLHYRRVDNIGWSEISILEVALRINERTKITVKFVNALKEKLEGKQIEMYSRNNQIFLKNENDLIV